ncbi:hypothetical protein MNBD_BACTEROID05-950, partial [hydrothermal vent metagenome]
VPNKGVKCNASGLDIPKNTSTIVIKERKPNTFHINAVCDSVCDILIF